MMPTIAVRMILGRAVLMKLKNDARRRRTHIPRNIGINTNDGKGTERGQT
jgi:hypothetical protein